jgi:hypothetical protein
MKGTEVIQSALRSTAGVLNWYLDDLSDNDLMVRPSPSANHIAWQLGHLIVAEAHLVHMIMPQVNYPPLPDGFAAKYKKETSTQDTGFATKAEYMKLFNGQRETTIGAVGGLSDADLDRKTEGQMARFAPTHGAMLLLVANHTLMHGGQFTVVRRKLGKPVLF